tara:strand:+ start:1575 stop:1925 length:351 start_codon:yes stop_codon:yes gene_type:complete
MTEYKFVNMIKSNNAKKKYTANFRNLNTGKNKKVNFGAVGYRDYTLVNNINSEYYLDSKEERDKVRRNYRTRHNKDLTTENNKKGLGAGSLSYYVLWTAPTIAGGIKNYIKKYWSS